MFVTAIGFGAFSALGVFIILIRCPRMLILHTLGTAWLLDIFFTALMFTMHWGTAVGGFVAVIASLFCSVGITACKFTIGYISDGVYYAGYFGDTRPLDKRSDPNIRVARETPL